LRFWCSALFRQIGHRSANFGDWCLEAAQIVGNVGNNITTRHFYDIKFGIRIAYILEIIFLKDFTYFYVHLLEFLRTTFFVAFKVGPQGDKGLALAYRIQLDDAKWRPNGHSGTR
jgi:hypothetical protein